MALINKQDTNGVKSLLGKGELGYDDYAAGGDLGRAYVGDGTTNNALAFKSELGGEGQVNSIVAGTNIAVADTFDPINPTVSVVNLTSNDVANSSTEVGGSVTVALNNKESSLGNPAASDYMLTSDMAGNRAWIPVPATGVESVNNKTGVVVIGTDDVMEGTINLYYTDTRADERVQLIIDDVVPSTATVYSSSEIDTMLQEVLNFKGGWNADTNAPMLSNATGEDNDYYIVTIAGTQDLGNGSVDYAAGDTLIHNGSMYERFGGSNLVTSVNGQTGDVVLNKSDVGLANVDNTSDADKPVSNATSTALGFKSDTTHNHDSLYEPKAANIQAHIADTSGNPHAVTQTQVGLPNVDNTSDALKPVSTATQSVLDEKMRWKGPWVSATYNENDLVIDNGWTMIANTTTTDPAAPQPLGDPERDVNQAALVDVTGPNQVVSMKNFYAMEKEGWLQALYIKIPHYDEDTHTKILVTNILTGSLNVYNNPILASGEWVALSASNLVAQVGDNYSVELQVYNATPAGQITGGWTIRLSGIPSTGEVVLDDSSLPTSISYNYTDADSNNKQTELDNVVVGSIIELGETSAPDRHVQCEVTAVNTAPSGYVTYTVTTIDGERDLRGGQISTTVIEVPITIPTHYYNLDGYRPGNDPSWATVTTALEFGGVDQSVADAGFGIDVLFQAAEVSEDWDVVAHSEGSGAPSTGGGSPISIIDNLTSTDSSAALSANMGRELNVIKADVAGDDTQAFLVKDAVGGQDAVAFTQAKNLIAAKEDDLASPTVDGYILSSTIAKVRTWIPAPINTDISAVWGNVSGMLSNQADIVAAFAAKEDSLGDPATDGFVLQSLANGTRSWVAQSGGVSDHTELTSIGSNTHTQIDTHISNSANPHGVTKTQLGLGNVDDTSDAGKPVSTATQTALDLKYDEVSGVTDNVVAFGGTGVLKDSTQNVISIQVTGEDAPPPVTSDGDMTKAVYDINNNGVVDNSELVNNLTVETAVPPNAVFTDTLYDDTQVKADIATNAGNITTNADGVSSNGELIATMGTKLATIDEGAQVNASATTLQGNVFNINSGLVQLDSSSRLPAVDGSQLTNLPSAGGQVDSIVAGTNITVSADPVNPVVSATTAADVLVDADTVSAVSPTNKLITQAELASSGGGDMLKSVYDINGNGTVDNTEKVNNLTVETAVPVGALFTDSGVWGSITGTITDQLDLVGAFDTKEDSLGNPTLTGQVLSSDTSGNRSWVNATATDENAIWGNITGTMANQTDLDNRFTALETGKEDDLGDPLGDGYVLTSTIAGVRSWDTRTASWGALTGTLSNQTDLQNELNAKVNLTDSINVLGDVDTLTAVPSTNDTFRWDGTNWIPDSRLTTHVGSTLNPHGVTKSQIGLGNANNTSDVDKPISTAQQTEFNNKENSLGNPSVNGYHLASTSAGVRTWEAVPPNTDVAAVWGNITGTLSAQTDLGTAFDLKLDKTGGTVTGDIDIVSGSGAKLTIQSTVGGGQPQLHLVDNNLVPRGIFGADSATGDVGLTRIDNAGVVEGTMRLDTLGNVKLLAGPTETTPIPTEPTHLTNKKYVDDYGETLEPDLGLPAGNNYVLASDTLGNRTWFDASVLGVTSVNGSTGVVVLKTVDIAEDTNLYFTDARSDARVQVAIQDSTVSATTLYSSTKVESVVSTAITGITYPVESVNSKTGVVSLDTGDLSENGNLFFTNVRADARVQTAIQDTISSTTTLYSSAKVDALISGSLSYKGGWDASTNTPTISDGTGSNGDFYKVEIAGTQDLGSGPIDFTIGDDVIHNGTAYERFGSTSAVDSVNGQTGVIVLNTNDISETSNLYYTDARVDARLSGVIDDNANNTTKTWSSSKLTAQFSGITYPVDSVNNKTGTIVLNTDDIAEGSSNLYFTNARTDARLSNVIDDNQIVGSLTWSSTKIDNAITSATGSITYPVTSVNGKQGNVTVTKADVQLGNCDNTSDANKPLSSATVTALSGKSDTDHNHAGTYEPANANIQGHIAITDGSNPHATTMVSLTDVPASLTGRAGARVTVNATETGFDYDSPSVNVSEAKPTGLIDGGELNIVNLNLDVEVIEGNGIKVDSYTNPSQTPTYTELSWNTIQVPIEGVAPQAGDQVYILIVEGSGPGPIPGTTIGLIHQFVNIAPDPSIVRDEIYLGYLIYNGIDWGEVSAPVVVNNSAVSLAEFVKTVVGPTFSQQGGTISEAAAFTLDRAAGVIWELNRNWHVNKRDPHRESFNEQLGFAWRYINRDFSTTSALTSTVDPTQYDNNGTVGAVGGNPSTTTIQRLFVDPRDNYWVLYGQSTYSSYNEAVSKIGVDETSTILPNILNSSLFLGYIISERTETDWTVDNAKFISVIEATGGGAGSTPVETFLELTDTPVSYTGNAGKVLVSNPGETALEFSDQEFGIGEYIGTSIAISSDGSALGNLTNLVADNIAIGDRAGANITTGGILYPGYNTFLGTGAGEFVTTGSGNLFFGVVAGSGNITDTVTGNENLAIGGASLTAITSGNDNVALGIFAGSAITTGSYNICIGTHAGEDITTQSKQLRIGDDTTTLISGDISAKKLSTPGEFKAKSVIFDGLFNIGNISGAAAFNIDNGQYQTTVLTGNVTISIAPPSGPATFYVHVYQDATGGRVVTLPAGQWTDGTPKAFTTTANAHDLLMIHYYGGTNYVYELMLNLS